MQEINLKGKTETFLTLYRKKKCLNNFNCTVWSDPEPEPGSTTLMGTLHILVLGGGGGGEGTVLVLGLKGGEL